jgi:2-oxoglutarate ferredoxin oxidoreductase subunit delta
MNFEKLKKNVTRRIIVDQQICNGCETCVSVCPSGVLKIIEVSGKRVAAAINTDKCQGCHSCEALCFNKAIKISE